MKGALENLGGANPVDVPMISQQVVSAAADKDKEGSLSAFNIG